MAREWTQIVTVIFQHIPKAAGSTLLSVLRRQYSPAETYHISGLGGLREAEFARLPSHDLAHLRLVTGHLYYGIHACLPGAATYVTMLRHPVDRVISHYRYVKRSPRHYLHQRVAGEKMTLEEYVSCHLSVELDNGQVRSLYGVEHMEVAYGECSLDMLRTAREHLRESYSVVGVTDRFDESLLLMHKRLRWKHLPLYVRKNVTGSRSDLPVVPRRVVEKIERANALDMALYRDASISFGEDISRSGVIQDLRRFRLLNEAYGRYVRARQFMGERFQRRETDSVHSCSRNDR